MTDESDTNPTNPNDSSKTTAAEFNRNGRCGDRGCGRRRGRKAFIVVALIGSFLAGGFILGHHRAYLMGEHPGPWMNHAAWSERADGPPANGSMSFMSQADRIEQGRAMAVHALSSLDATPEQTTKILAIFDATAAALKDMPETMFTSRLQVATILTSPTVDRDKLETLRAARISDADTASKTLVKAISDAAEILTPDQRIRAAMLMEHLRHAPPPLPPHP